MPSPFPLAKKRSRKKAVLIAAVLFAFSTGAWWFMHRDAGAPPPQPPILISVEAAKRQDVQMTIPNVGTVVTYQSVAVRSRLDSQVMEVKFKDGEQVEEGQLLFVLDDRALKAQLHQAQAALERDQAQLENLQQQYERTKTLTSKGYSAQADLDAAKAAYEAQRALIGADRAAVQNYQVLLQYTAITAPISGRAGTINVTAGNTVKANDVTPMVTINQLKPIRVQVSLPQQYLTPVKEAMAQGEVRVEASPPDSTAKAEGVLEYIDNSVDQSTGTFAARASFANESETLWPGMFVNLILDLGSQNNVLTVPEVAVQHGQDGDFVFVVDETNKAHKREVKIARMQTGLAILLDGIKEGEQVVTDGLLTLKDGSDVKIETPAPADATH